MRKGNVMIRIVVSLCMLLALGTGASAATRGVSGSWKLVEGERKDGRLQLMLDIDGDGNMGMGFDRTDFTGLTAEQVASDPRVPVRFQMNREAGTIDFEGTFRGGRGTGEFDFIASSGYLAKLEQLGVDTSPEDGEKHDLLSLALFDVSTEYVRSMQAIGYREDLGKYVEFRIFRVDPAFVKEMAALGFAKLPADKLVETRVHDVTPEYIRKMRAAGEDLTLDELIQSKIFQVTPEFAAEMERAGYRNLEHEMLVQFRVHGVSPEFVRELDKLGYDHIAADDLVAMRVHGVTPEFIRRVEAAGYKNVPIDKLVHMRIFDIDPEMIGALDGKK